MRLRIVNDTYIVSQVLLVPKKKSMKSRLLFSIICNNNSLQVHYNIRHFI